MQNPLPGRICLFVFLLLMLLATDTAYGQLNVRRASPPGCGTLVQREGPYKENWQAFENAIARKNLQQKGARETTEKTYILPVVFHVIHQSGAENLPELDIKNTLTLLNDAFANRNAYTKPDGSDVQIRFCMAQLAPDGTAQLGLTRHESVLTDMTIERDDETLKQIIQWDPRSYINIWVVRNINSAINGPGVAGYAYLPNLHGNKLDGIVVEAAFLNGNADGAKVLIHEMGHYLGLYHTFEGGCKNDNCTTDGDRVCDTPPDGSVAPALCGTTVNTCTTDASDRSNNNPFRPVSLGGLGDQPDMTRNYMDYGLQACLEKFTEGQRQRMRDALTTTRASLLVNTFICAECSKPIVATINVPDAVAAGTPVTFPLTLNNPAVNIAWEIDGQSYHNQAAPTITFHQAKSITVTATITNADPGCYAVVSKRIEITCNAMAPFTANPGDWISPGETIHFNSTATGTLTWKLDGITVGTGPQFNYYVPDEKGRLVTLTADNGACATQSEPYYVRPNNCVDSKENNVWYFGEYAGVDFNQRQARAIPGQIRTQEGSAVLCDEQGQPLLHSNGEAVYNSVTHIRLQNGDGLTGSTTTTQSALFVPLPGDDRYVYLFTLAFQAGELTPGNSGVSYSVIDRQGGGGTGAVIKKNIEILSPAPEMITAVKNKTGNGIWIIAHKWNSDAFYAWLLTEAGLSATPVISHSGAVLYAPEIVGSIGEFAIGELKASPSGNKLAYCCQGWGFLELLDFNTATGMVSNPIHLKNQYTGSAYGVAFSPDERYLYGTTINTYRVFRFDIQAGSAAAINNSAALIYGATAGTTGGSIQLAPDGKLYACPGNSRYLSVINNPNAKEMGDCGFVLEGLQLLSTTVYGLPTQVQSLLYSVKPVIYGPSTICRITADTLVRYSFAHKGRATYTWWHNGTNALENTTDSTATIRITDSGKDTLFLKRSALCMDMIDTLVILSGNLTTTFIGNDTTVCVGAPVPLKAGAGFNEYKWSTGEYAETVSVSKEGWVWVDVINETGCRYRDSLLVSYYRLPALDLGRDTAICNSIQLTLKAPPGMDSYSWNDGSSGSTLGIADSGTYWVNVTRYGCSFKDSIHVLKGIPAHLFDKDTLNSCFSDPIQLYVPPGALTHHWHLPDGTDTVARALLPWEIGWHTLTYTNNCGTVEDSIYNYMPRFIKEDTLTTCHDTLFVPTAFEVLNVFNLDGGGKFFEKVAGGIKFYKSGRMMLFGFNETGCIFRQLVSVLVDSSFTKPARDIELGNDTVLCGGIVVPLNAGPSFKQYTWNDGTHNQFTTAYSAGKYKVNASYCGYQYTDSIQVIACETPNNGGGGNCDVVFRLKPNPGSYQVTLYSYCPYVVDKKLALRVFSIDGKEIVHVFGKMEDLNATLNRIMPSLAAAVYIIDIQCEVCSDIRQRLKWQIIR